MQGDIMEDWTLNLRLFSPPFAGVVSRGRKQPDYDRYYTFFTEHGAYQMLALRMCGV
jgi:hypothetical protein